MGLYENIKKAAKEKGYSVNQLEKELGFARSYILKFKTITPSADKIEKIADFLGVSSRYLMTGEVDSKYYLNEETARIAQEIYENEEMRVLFDAAKDTTPEGMRAAVSVMSAFKKEDVPEDGC